ncbi:MAG: ABC transporter ATP-binding protein, partial [Bacteroidales bacterium]|nr:ABC transporter ATP-binding protein [Bacteroidales bacterium]
FCNEPNYVLDPVTANLINKLIRKITKEFKITTIVNTHDMNLFLEICYKISFIYNGELLWEGSNKDIRKTDKKEIQEFIFATKLTQKLK